MRLLIHDFAGHPFQVQLSRELAARGHQVLHLSAEGLAGPKGNLSAAQGDATGLSIRGVPLSGHFRKYSPLRRLVTQREYAHDLERVIGQEKPDVVLSGNTPIDVQAHVLRFCHHRGIGFTHWVQDEYSLALDFLLRPKIGAAAGLVTLPYRWLDGWVARNSDGVVAISPGFLPHLRWMGARAETLTVIENWAPLDEVRPAAHRNAWSEAQGLNGEPVFLYAGSMGLKHRPELIYALAQAVQDKGRVVVVSEGVGRQFLAQQPRLPNMTLLDFQPYERLSEILASADVLLATLEVGAGAFAVPSKVLTYLCAGRPVLLSAPTQNLASEVVTQSGGGVAVSPGDAAGWVEAGRKLVEDVKWRTALGLRARQYAEATFNIKGIADRFEAVLTEAAARRVKH